MLEGSLHGLAEGGQGHGDKFDTRCMHTENSNSEDPNNSKGDRWRELFPIPLCEDSARPVGPSVSSRRRRARVRRFVDDTNSVIQALNEMYGPSPGDEFSSSSCATKAQRLAQHELFQEVSKVKRPSTVLTEREAVQELLHTDLSYSGEVMTSVRAYDRGLLSIPSCGSSAVDLLAVLDEIGRETILEPQRCMLKSEDEIGVMMESSTPICTYMDPTLRDNLPTYRGFISDLYKCGMLDFTCKSHWPCHPFLCCQEVWKLRLILDCRETNRMFREPPPLALGTGASWARISVPDKEKLYIAQSDIKDYFYSLQLPVGLRSLFSMPPVPSQLLRQLGVDTSHLPGLDPSGWVHPMLRVVPMGWSWAMWLSQRVHQFQSQLGANIGMDRVLVDGKQSPDLSTGEVLLLPYADNLNIAGTDKRRVQAAKDGAVAQLRQVGLVVHEELDATTTAQSLGFLIDGEAGRVTPIPDRIEKIRLALGWLSKRPRVSGHSIQKILGHVVHFCMLKQPLLSIPRRLYDFVTYAGHRRCRLWAGAAVEARWLRDLLPLVSADLRKPLSGVLTASDASLSGIAVCSRDVQLEDIHSLIKTKEAWRYKGRNPASRPRANFFESEQLDPFTDISTVKPIFPDVVDPYELNEEFVEVSKHLHTSEDWSLRFSQYVQFLKQSLFWKVGPL